MMEGRIENNGKSLWRARRKLRRPLLCLVAAVFLWAQAGTALAATYTVTNTNDSGAGSLRAALSNLSVSGSDTVVFDASLEGQTITLNTPITYTTASASLTLSGANVTITAGAGNNDGLLRNNSGWPGITTLSNAIVLQNGRKIVTGSGSGYVSAGGGSLASGAPITGTFTVTGSRVEASDTGTGSSTSSGGGIHFGTNDSTAEIAGLISNNTASATTTGSGYADVSGGGAYAGGGVTSLSATVSNNSAIATGSTSGNVGAQAGGFGGGFSGLVIGAFSGAITGNSATATNTGSGSASAIAGGLMAYRVSTLAGTISGNSVTASATDPAATVWAYGGGAYIWGGGTNTITKGDYSNNQVIAIGANAVADGGAMYIESGTLNLNPSAGDITFQGNTVTTKANAGDTGVTRANAISFGGNSLYAYTSRLNITGSSSNTTYLYDGVSVGIPEAGATFTMTKDGSSYFNWGGPNIFDAAGGSTVTLDSRTQFYSGFSLDNPKVNSSANIVLNLNDSGNYYQVARPTDLGLPTESISFSNTTLNLSNNARLVPYGTLILGDNSILNIASGSGIDLENGAILQTSGSSQINGGTLAFNTGNTLKVDLGKTLTLGAATNLAFNSGTLSVGVGASNASGLIDMTANTATAPTFAGANTLDISTWIPGGYTVLKAGTAIDPGAPGTFGTFTVGGNALGAGMSITPTLTNGGKDLLVTAALNQDSAEKVWGGTAGTWNYTNTNWSGPTNFNLGDLAKFDGTGAASPLAVTVGGTQVETAGMSITGGSYTFSGGKIVGRTDISEGSAITPTGRLDIAGAGNITFNNAVDFSGGLTASSTTTISLADYTGGRVVLGGLNLDFSGKLNVRNQAEHSTNGGVRGGGVSSSLIQALSLLEGSVIHGNHVSSTVSTGNVSAHGGGVYFLALATSLAGTIDANTATATATGSYDANTFGGGVYSNNISTMSGIISANTSSAISDSGSAWASSGGLIGTAGTLSGTVIDNTAIASSASGSATATGGGTHGGVNFLSATITGNKAEAVVTNGPGAATALGGGMSILASANSGPTTISKGTYTNNQAIAIGSNARAQGGAIFFHTNWNTISNPFRLILDPTAGAITFSGNTVTTKANAADTGTTTANAIHFGRRLLEVDSEAAASLTIQNSLGNTNLVTIADGVTTDINNGKTFTMSQTGGTFLWGGPNVFDSAGGDAVALSGGTMRLANGFTLDRGYTNLGTGNLALTVSGGNLKSEGAATSLKHTALSVSSGGKLTVDLGSTLTLDAASTFAMNGGTLSVGVGAGNSSGLINMTANTTTAPIFTGSNTLDISTWIAGGYTVLKAGTAMLPGAPGTFGTFTVGGNALGAGMSITPSLANGGKDLLVTASLGRNNAELAWGGAATGNWNYTDTNWTLSGGIANFLPKDAALLNGMGGSNHAITLGGTSVSLSGLHAMEQDNYTLSGAALHIDSSGAAGAAVPALSYAGKLVKDGSGTLTLNTGSFANPNRINTIEINGDTLALGDGFALEPVSGRGSLAGNGGTLSLLGTAYLTNIDARLVNAFSLVSGNTLVLADSSIDRNTVGLNVAGGATLASAGAGNSFSGSALNLNGGTLDMRGNSVFTLNAALAGTGGTTRFNAGDSQIKLASGGSLGAGVMDVDLNRAKTLAAIDVTGGTLALADSTLRLRHSGNGVADGSWLIVNGAYTDYEGNAGGSGKSFQTLDIVTATLDGVLRNDPTQIWFDGTYTPLTPSGITGLSTLSPNARGAASGLLERIEYGSGPVYDYLYSLSGDAFNNAALGVLPYATAEGAVSQGIQGLTAHNAAAMAAFGYAFGNDALASSQSFAPLAFQASSQNMGTLGFNMGSQSRRDQALATARQNDRMASLDGDVGYGHSTYSILGNWTPAMDSTRNLVASANPEYSLNALGAASGPNTAFGARIWGGYLGNFAHQDNKGGYAGYDADQNGFLLGGSFDLGQSWTVGAYAGWTTGSTRYNDIKTRIDTDATHVGAFARYKKELGPGTAKLTGDILYSFTDNDSRRTVPLGGPLGDQHMKGSFDQNIIGGGLEAAYDWKPGFDEATVITPYVAARYAHLDQDGFTESGSLGLKVGKTDADSFTSTVGVKAARDFRVGESVILTPKATVGWLRQWADRDVSANSSFIGSPVTFMTRSVKQDADAALLGAGLDVLVKTGKTWDLGLKLGYGADIRQNSNDQTVFVGFEVKF